MAILICDYCALWHFSIASRLLKESQHEFRFVAVFYFPQRVVVDIFAHIVRYSGIYIYNYYLPIVRLIGKYGVTSQIDI